MPVVHNVEEAKDFLNRLGHGDKFHRDQPPYSTDWSLIEARALQAFSVLRALEENAYHG
jgi:hypothetical protein